jgi:sugar O-acyltransferase (sialic acid O-acetyltransferase NeuD family)
MKLIIFGKGGFGREVEAAIKNSRLSRFYDIVMMEEGEDLLPIYNECIIAIGDPNVRSRLANELRYSFGKIILGTCYSSNIGGGTIIQPGAIITVNCNIGKHVQVNLNATVGHDCNIGDCTTIAPGAHISGNVTIGKRCYIGTGAVIKQNINICDDVTIGAGGVVVKDITESGIYVGCPVNKK